MSRFQAVPYVKLAAMGLSLALFPGAKNGCGSEEANTTVASPVQAVTTLLEHSDGSVEAELVLISTAVNPHAFVDSAKEVELRVPSGETVPLESSSPGHYTASSDSETSSSYK